MARDKGSENEKDSFVPLASSPLPRTRFANAGHSLVEVLIAMTAGLVVLGAALGAYTHLRDGFGKHQETSARQQDVRIGLAVLASELRLAGIGMQLIGRPLLSAAPDELTFYANLSGRSTQLSHALAPGDVHLQVRDGGGWRKGKRVFVCDRMRCAGGTLARQGQGGTLSLSRPLGKRFPSGSQVLLANVVRYYLRKAPAGAHRLMRMVDGGASTLMEAVESLRFTFLDRAGRPPKSSAGIARIRIELTMQSNRETIRLDVALRT